MILVMFIFLKHSLKASVYISFYSIPVFRNESCTRVHISNIIMNQCCLQWYVTPFKILSCSGGKILKKNQQNGIVLTLLCKTSFKTNIYARPMRFWLNNESKNQISTVSLTYRIFFIVNLEYFVSFIYLFYTYQSNAQTLELWISRDNKMRSISQMIELLSYESFEIFRNT